MASTTFIDNQTTIFADWLNDANNAVYNGVFVSPTITATSMVCTGTASGAGFTNLINNVFASPSAIGSATPNTGAFTTLTSTSLSTTTLTASTVNSPLSLRGTTSGTVSLAIPAVAGSNTITFPSGSGTVSVQGLSSNIVSGTAVATTSGTAINFTGIPSWAKRITVMFNNVSHNGGTAASDYYIIQIGSGSFTTSGYSCFCVSSTTTTGFLITNSVTGGATFSGVSIIGLIGSNTWSQAGNLSGNTSCQYSAGSVTIGGTLDRVRITTVGGTDTFDAGSINILYE